MLSTSFPSSSLGIALALAILTTSVAARATSEIEPDCGPTVSFLEVTARGAVPVIPSNAHAVPIGLDGRRTSYPDPGSLSLRRIVAFATVEGPWSITTQRKPLAPYRFDGVLVAALPPSPIEGHYLLTYTPATCGGFTEPKGQDIARNFDVGPPSPFPIAIGSVSAKDVSPGRTNPDALSNGGSGSQRAFDVELRATDEFAAFAVVSHLSMDVVPSGTFESHVGGDNLPGAFEAGLRFPSDHVLTAQLRGDCKAPGPIRVRVEGGVFGEPDLAPLEFELGACTSADVAAAARRDWIEAGWTSRGCDAGGSASKEVAGPGAASIVVGAMGGMIAAWRRVRRRGRRSA
ncbi:MAG: hypothetical protein U0169_27355 [Polyangiaceae bacterium]